MEAKELRIGNLVFNQMNQVINVGWEQIKFAEDFNSIPLSEEWLLKFGFEKEGFYWFKQYEWNNWGMRLNTFDSLLVVFHGFANQFSELTSIKYVHQLQNLYFSLTGEELELK